MNLVNDVIAFLNTLTFVDYVFFFAVIILLILIITLIYFIKINEEVLRLNNVPRKSELEIINEAIKSEAKPLQVEFSDFEKEQEEKAIISYDELINNNKSYGVHYTDEKEVDGISIKKVEFNDSASNEINEVLSEPVKIFNYRKEEEFLIFLKQIQALLD